MKTSLKNKILCKMDALLSVTEDMLQEDKILSLTIDFDKEVMVFLTRDSIFSSKEKELDISYFRVIIYKSNPTDNYIHYASDGVWFYKENSKYTTLYFFKYGDALRFISNELYHHHEFQARPTAI